MLAGGGGRPEGGAVATFRLLVQQSLNRVNICKRNAQEKTVWGLTAKQLDPTVHLVCLSMGMDFMSSLLAQWVCLMEVGALAQIDVSSQMNCEQIGHPFPWSFCGGNVSSPYLTTGRPSSLLDIVSSPYLTTAAVGQGEAENNCRREHDDLLGGWRGVWV